jgi:hypothetical protein
MYKELPRHEQASEKCLPLLSLDRSKMEPPQPDVVSERLHYSLVDNDSAGYHHVLGGDEKGSHWTAAWVLNWFHLDYEIKVL